MMTVAEVLESGRPGWQATEEGLIVMDLGEYQVVIEPLLFGASYLAVYKIPMLDDGEVWFPDMGGELVGEKMPITLGTPAQRKEQNR